jgi:poly(A) polymerase
MSKPKLTPSHTICNRIQWDPRLNAGAFTVGYQERTTGTGITEKPVPQWMSNKDIPWHRLRYIRCGDIIVWDREQQLDLLASGQLPPTAWKTTAGPNVPTFPSRLTYHYVAGQWQPIPIQTLSETTPAQLSQLRLFSWNVLCDQYEKQRIRTAERIPAILDQLHHCNAEIILLQEATPQLVEAALNLPWLRDWYISGLPKGADLRPFGLWMLSRTPFSLVEHRYSHQKRVLVGTWPTGTQPLHIANVHLSSNHTPNAPQLREHQLTILLNYLQMLPGDCLIAGDFNGAGDEQAGLLTQHSFIDLWKTLHPEKLGYTFDPQNNPLAGIMSRTGEPGRLDCIWLRTTQPHWQPHLIELFANEPINPQTNPHLFPSDHFALRTTLTPQLPIPLSPQLPNSPTPTYHSALTLIPPIETWPAIQAIRRRHDRHVDRWMPHINLLYGFLPEAYFEQAAERIAIALKDFAPFEITLEGYETFTHHRSSTAWLKPVTNPPNALQQLQATLEQLFPQCNEQSTKSPAGFTPHLSVGQFPTPEAALAQLPPWHPVRFPVTAISLICRQAKTPFEVHYQIDLGTGTVNKLNIQTPPISPTPHLPNPPSPHLPLLDLLHTLEPPLTSSQKEHRQTITDLVSQACAEVLGQLPALYPLGSACLGVETAESDIDLLCIIPSDFSGFKFLEKVREYLQDLCDYGQVVKARVPVLRMQIDGIAVDLLYARCDKDSSTLDLHDENLQNYFDRHSWKALTGCLEANQLIETVSQKIPLPTFQTFLRAVRAWAKTRHLHGNAWGFLGNFSWAILVGWSCTTQTPANLDLETLLAQFFQTLANHDWRLPIALTEAGQQYRVRVPPDWVPVVTSIPPCQNSARNVTRSTAQILKSEFERGAAIIQKVRENQLTINTLFEPATLETQCELILTLTLTSNHPTALELSAGWLEGHIIGLILDLERQLNLFVRPWPTIQKQPAKRMLLLGLKYPAGWRENTTEPAYNLLIQQIVEGFIHQFSKTCETADLVTLIHHLKQQGV